jgi:hypothetical protein
LLYVKKLEKDLSDCNKELVGIFRWIFAKQQQRFVNKRRRVENTAPTLPPVLLMTMMMKNELLCMIFAENLRLTSIAVLLLAVIKKKNART